VGIHVRRSNFAYHLVLLMSALSMLGVQTVARAEVIGTERMLDVLERRATLDEIDAVLARAEIQSELQRLGVDPAETSARVAALSDAELLELADNLENLPAGGSVVGIVGVVFIVLLVLEFVGVIDIFKKI
jgi:hypothetical protein